MVGLPAATLRSKGLEKDNYAGNSTSSWKGIRNMQTVKRVKGTVALTVVVLLCIVLFSLLSLGQAKAATGETLRASTSSSGAQGDNYSGYYVFNINPSISSDGRYVAFDSLATNLVEGDTNGIQDIFRKNLTTGDTLLVSTSSSGVQGDDASAYTSITPDGRYVAFSSSANNLVEGDTNDTWDVFRKDLTTGETLRVSTSSSGTQGDKQSYEPSISSDGRYVAFYSYATNLVEGDTNDTWDVFRKDLTTGETLRASTSSSGAQGNGVSSYYPDDLSISSDGRYVAFTSYATNLVEGDTNGVQDIFRKDLTTGETLRASTSPSGAEGNSGSVFPSISSDGRYVAFDSEATNLVEGDTNGVQDIFRKELPVLIPTITAITPTSAYQGQTLNVNIVGQNTHFVNGPSATTFSGTGITVNSTTVTDATHATANITISPSTPTGPRDVNLTTGSETPTPLTGGFTVNAAAGLTVTSITPAASVENTIVNITNLAGTGFKTGATVRIEKTGTTVNATDVNVVSATKITCKLNLAGAPLGKYDVVVRNTDAQEARLTQGFSVTNICGGGAAIFLSIFGIVMGMMSLAGSTGLRRRFRRKK